jgi:hypothetical protein
MDPLTGEPVLGPNDEPIFRDWELHMENWSNSDFVIVGAELIWHGKAIGGGQIDQDWLAYDENWEIPVAQRVQGFVGLDVNNDDEFSGIDNTIANEWNNRYVQERVEWDFDASTIRSDEIQRRLLDDFIDNDNDNKFSDGDVRLQEPYLANALVEAFSFTVDGMGNDIINPQPVAQFLTGADGNYYFDLLPGNYIIRVTDRAGGSVATEDVNTPSQYLQHYKSEWRITQDWFYAPDRDAPVDTTGDGFEDAPGEIFYDAVTQAPVPYIMSAGQPRIPKAVTNLNFLMEPQAISANEVVITGTVWADINGDGVTNFGDTGLPNAIVYIDVNRNGINDDGIEATTDFDGNYIFTLPATEPEIYVVGVDMEPGWVASIAGGDQIALFLEPGEIYGDIPQEVADFFIDPPNDPNGSGPANATGFVWEDADLDGVRDPGEKPIQGIRVFIDEGAKNGIWDATERFAITATNGGYFFANLPNGQHQIDVDIANEGTDDAIYAVTFPDDGYHLVTVSPGVTLQGVSFGLENRARRDWGDLPDSFDTLAASGGPSHIVVPHFRLGNWIDGEPNGIPSVDALGDDNADNVFGQNDVDDGVSVISGGGLLRPGQNTLQVTVFGVGGFLSGWIDWNNNNTFDVGERLSFTDANTGEALGQEADLGPGTFQLNITAPAVIPNAPLGSRFRWGELGLDNNSQAYIGEVEDYHFQASSVIVSPSLPGDFNNDGNVDGADYVMYMKLVGTQTQIPNGTDPDAVVPADQPHWVINYGSSSGGGSESGSGGGGETAAAESDPPANELNSPIGALASAPSSQASVADETTVTVDVSPNESSSDSGVSVNNAFAAPRAFVAISFNTTAPAFGSAANDVFETAASESETESVDLLLVEAAWADLDEFGNEAAPITTRSGEEEEGYGDLELAVAFEDEMNWWSL